MKLGGSLEPDLGVQNSNVTHVLCHLKHCTTFEYCMYCMVHGSLPWQPWLGFFVGITPPDTLHRIGMAKRKGANEHFKERCKNP